MSATAGHVSPPADRAWRAFPWDPDSRPGERWSPTYAPPVQGQGRFDLPGVPAGVFYLSETADHAVGERIQAYRGQPLEADDLVVEGKGLALVALPLAKDVRDGIVDLCDPRALVQLDLGPDRIAARDRRVTQGIAARIHSEGWTGLRWWSAFFGEWHGIALFRDRIGRPLAHLPPEPLHLAHAAVVEAARALGIRRAAA